MKLHEVNEGIHKNKKRRRIGRGPGSGWEKLPVEDTMARNHAVVGRRKRLSRAAQCLWCVAFLSEVLITVSL